MATAQLRLVLVTPETTLLEVDSDLLGSFTLTLPLVLLFCARALDGLTGGNVSVANAYMADISDDANRSVNFGRMAMAASLGFVLGPAAAGLLGRRRRGRCCRLACNGGHGDGHDAA